MFFVAVVVIGMSCVIVTCSWLSRQSSGGGVSEQLAVLHVFSDWKFVSPGHIKCWVGIVALDEH